MRKMPRSARQGMEEEEAEGFIDCQQGMTEYWHPEPARILRNENRMNIAAAHLKIVVPNSNLSSEARQNFRSFHDLSINSVNILSFL